jgi:hypothetical protein
LGVERVDELMGEHTVDLLYMADRVLARGRF